MPSYELNFSDYWRIVRRRKFVILSTAIVISIFSFFFTLTQPKIFESYATVKVEESKTVAGILLESVVPFSGGDLLETEANVVTSWPVAERAAKALGYITDDTEKDSMYALVDELKDRLETEIVSNTNLLKIIVKHESPQSAADIANAVAEAYVKENFNSRNAQARKVREFIEEQLGIISNNLQESENALQKFKSHGDIVGIAVRMQDLLMDLKSKLSETLKKYTEKHPHVLSLKGQIKDLENEIGSLPPREIEFARLKREVELNENSYATLRERLEEARITEASNIGNASIVDVAVPSNTPVTSAGMTTVFLGSILGLVMGFVLAFVMESTDTSIGAIEDVENFLKLSVLGVIPNIGIYQKKKKAVERLLEAFFLKKKETLQERQESTVPLVAHYAPKSPVAEAYRILRTNLRLTKDKKVLLFTSTLHQEGKSTVITNLALTTAQLGSRTLLLGCDLRKPVIAKAFGLKRDNGISDVLTGTKQLEDVIQGMTNILMGKITLEEAMKTPGLDNLSIITAGKYLMNPAELLGSKQMKSFIAQLRDKFDIIIIDSPPVLPVTDSLILAPMVDSVIMVYQVGRVGRGALLRAKAQLEGAGANIAGLVLNHVRPETAQAGSEYYQPKYYGKEEKES